MGFNITVLGSSGGSVEGSTCSLMIKPADLSYHDIIEGGHRHQLVCFDAGSGMGLLAEIIYNERHGIRDNSVIQRLYNDSQKSDCYIKAPVSHPFKGLDPAISPFLHAQRVFERLEVYLISHPHLDHVTALVLNSAGTSNCKSKIVYGSESTTGALKNHIFNNIIWPDMSYLRRVVLTPKPHYSEFKTADETYTITMFEISHGCTLLDTKAPHNRFMLLSFLLTHNELKQSVMLFGDFESDVSSGLKLNLWVWKHIAPLIVKKLRPLRAIVLECSSPNSTTPESLYGHLKPKHLIEELTILNEQCLLCDSSNKHPLENFDIIITHVKESLYDALDPCKHQMDPRTVILNELNELNKSAGLGLRISIAISGATISI